MTEGKAGDEPAQEMSPEDLKASAPLREARRMHADTMELLRKVTDALAERIDDISDDDKREAVQHLVGRCRTRVDCIGPDLPLEETRGPRRGIDARAFLAAAEADLTREQARLSKEAHEAYVASNLSVASANADVIEHRRTLEKEGHERNVLNAKEVDDLIVVRAKTLALNERSVKASERIADALGALAAKLKVSTESTE